MAEKTGSLHQLDGKEKAKIMKEKLRELDFSGPIPRDRMQMLLKRLGLSPAECGALFSFFGAGDTIDMDNFIDFLFVQPPTYDPLGPCSLGCWNIRSPELSGNLFEMYPGDGVINDPDQNQLLCELIEHAQAILLEKDTSEKLKDILPDDLPVKLLKDSPKAGPLENAPLNEKHKEPMKEFLGPRFKDKSPEELEAYATKWLAEPATRWDFWKEQTAREFFADDGSGGKSKINDCLPFKEVPGPLLDDKAWNLGLGVGDQKYRFFGPRAVRTAWMMPEGAVPEDMATLKGGGPQPGEYDCFKLMVWDLVVEAVKDRARKKWAKGEDDWDKNFKGLKDSLTHTPSTEEHVDKIAKRLLLNNHPSILVLCEVSEEVCGGKLEDAMIMKAIKKIEGAPTYTLIRDEPLDKTSNTVLLVNTEVFEKATLEPFRDAEGKEQLGRVLGARLETKKGEVLQLIGLHLPSNGYNIPQVCDEIEKRLQTGTPTIVAGDLNLDLREAKKKAKLEDNRPNIKRLIQASKHL